MTPHTGLNCQEFIERAEYRKPDWLVQMEMIKERLAGGGGLNISHENKAKT